MFVVRPLADQSYVRTLTTRLGGWSSQLIGEVELESEKGCLGGHYIELRKETLANPGIERNRQVRTGGS
jgi:hypothetical protein